MHTRKLITSQRQHAVPTTPLRLILLLFLVVGLVTNVKPSLSTKPFWPVCRKE